MSFQQALSGLNAAAKSLDITGNNVANANTVGFKSSRAEFADVYASSLTGAASTQVGLGVKLAAIEQQFAQGSVTATSNPLDLAINGQGFFRLNDNGTTTYTRAGQFHIDKDGYIVNPENKRLTGYNVGANGQINKGSPADLRISNPDSPPRMSTAVDTVVNLDSRKTALLPAGFNVNDPATYHDSTSLAVYDSLGNAHTLTNYFMKTGANTWNVYSSLDGTQVGAGAAGTLTFKTDGSLDLVATTLPINLSLPVGGGATSPFPVKVDLTGSTQFGSNFGVNTLNQDGYTAGRLSGFSIGSDGVLLGRYSNGNTTAQGQIVLANFQSPTSLQPSGGTGWTETSESGAAVVGVPGGGSLGAIQASAVEDSNVDLTAELVNMITAQRFYQANAQTIKTQDSLLQTMVNLR